MHTLTSFWFESYRAFRRRTEVTLKPLTLVFGKNSSGKSALVRFPLMMVDSIRHPLPGFRLQGPQLNYAASFSELVYGIGPGFVSGGVGGRSNGQEWHLNVRVGPERGTDPLAQRLDSWTLSPPAPTQQNDGDRPSSAVWKVESVSPGDGYALHRDQDSLDSPDLRFEGLSPRCMSQRLPSDGLESALRYDYLGPFRGDVQPSWEKRQASLSGPSGSWAHRLLLSHEGDGKLLGFVNDWLHRQLGWHLTVRVHPAVYPNDLFGSGLVAPQRFSVLLNRLTSPSNVLNIVSLGTGMQQVLPVVVQAASLAQGELATSLLVCEEPEAHLHPAAHAALADLYLEVAKLGKAPLLIETHSEILLLRVRTRIAEGKFDPKDINLIYVDDASAPTEAKSLPIDGDGWVEDWPAGVFDEDVAERRALGRAMAALEKSSP